MATTYLRHQLDLHGPKIGWPQGRALLLAAAVLALPLSASAQKASRSRTKVGRNGQVKSVTVDNLVGYDDRPLHLGLYVAPNFSSYQIERAPGYPSQGVSANSIISPGFAVGFLGDLRLGRYGALNFSPGVSFLTRRVEFKNYGYVQQPETYPNDPMEIEDQEIGSTQLEFPLLLKLKSERRRNTRVYVVAGVKPSLNLGGRRKNPEVNLLQAADSDIALEYGVGLDLFYPFFKFSPELRFSHGLKNLYVPSSNDVYSRSLQSMKSHTVTLYLNIWSGR